MKQQSNKATLRRALLLLCLCWHEPARGTALRPSLLHAPATPAVVNVDFTGGRLQHPPPSSTLVADARPLRDVFKACKLDPSRLSQARELADTLLASGRINTVREAHAAISIYKLAGGGTNLHLPSAVAVLDSLQEQGTQPDTLVFNNILDLCSRGSGADGDDDVALVQSLLHRMDSLGVPRDATSYTSLIQTLSKAGHWHRSIKTLQDMKSAGVSPDTICYSAAVQACTRAGRWKEATALVHIMKTAHVPLDAVLCNSVIAACAQAGEWTVALRIMETMRAEGLVPDAYTYTSAIVACDAGGRDDEAMALLEDMLARCPAPLPASPFNAAITASLRAGHASQALDLFRRMATLGVAPSTITHTALLTGLAKLGCWEEVLGVYQSIESASASASEESVEVNEAILGTALSACDKLAQPLLAARIFAALRILLLSPLHTPSSSSFSSSSSSSSSDAVAAPTLAPKYWHMLLSAHRQHHPGAQAVFSEMTRLNIAPSAQCYTTLIASCKPKALVPEAEALLLAYEQSPEYTAGNAYPYVALISVCVGARQWERALDVLGTMERLNMASKAAFNSAIEALEAAGESVRCALLRLSLSYSLPLSPTRMLYIF